MVESFDELKLAPALLKGMYEYGYTKPSEIQKKMLKPLVRGRDVMAQASSGTGKTSAFCIAALQCVWRATRGASSTSSSTSGRRHASSATCYVLCMSPSRELAQQSERLMKTLGLYMDVSVHCCVGGKTVGDDVKKLSRGIHCVSGTPGRVMDMIKRKALDVKQVRLLVLDEADEMLGRGLRDKIYDVHRHLPASCQVAFISATMSSKAAQLAHAFLTEPYKVLVRKDELTLAGISQFSVQCEKEEWKFDTLCDLYGKLCIQQSVVFVNTRAKAERVATGLRDANFDCALAHGKMSQKQREDCMARFRAGEHRVLVTTDVWARGIDVQQVSLVVNYDLPQTVHAYLHRIGRSGRWGRKGVAINFLTKPLPLPSKPESAAAKSRRAKRGRPDMEMLAMIEHHYAIKVKPLPASIDKFL